MISLPILGMSCASCAGRVERALARLPGVHDVHVNLAAETAQFELDGANPPAAQTVVAQTIAAIAAIEKAGYQVPLASTELAVGGMTCASCSGRVERALMKVPGVLEASVNLATNTALIHHMGGALGAGDLLEQLLAAVRKAGYEAQPAVADDGVGEHSGPGAASAANPWWSEGAQVGWAALLSAPLMLPMLAELWGQHWMLPALWQCLLASAVLFGFGARFFSASWRALRAGSANMDVLVALGTSAAWGLSVALWWREPQGMPHLYFESAAVVITLVRLGKWLEARAKRQTLAALDALQALRPATATVRRDGAEVSLPLHALQLGDLLVVRPGERLPADGVVVEGRSHVDESLITGESLPVAREVGDAVTGGSVNAEGLLLVRATALGAESQISRIVRLVATAQGAKAPIQAQVDKVAAVFVPAVLLIALATLLGWLWAGAAWPQALIHAVSVLVIACPCALGLATPATLMVASGLAARQGILVRDASALERLREVQVVAFDKTGTLTEGKPKLQALQAAPGVDEAALLASAAALQTGSEHPLAKAVLQSARDAGLSLPATSGLQAVPGRGITGMVQDAQGQAWPLALGSARWMDDLKVDRQALLAAAAEHEARGLTVSWLACLPAPLEALTSTSGSASPPESGPTRSPILLGLLAFGDTARPHAAAAVAELARLGLRSVLISGDNPGAAQHLAQQVGITEVHAEVRPEQKAELVAQLKRAEPEGSGAAPNAAQRAPLVVAMVGDGINDAPALAAADVGLAMAHADGGTDIAMHSAGITLLRGEPWSVVQALSLARATGAKIRQNLFWAFAYNVIGLPLAAGGLLSPMVAGAAMAASSVCVLSNALWLRRWKAPSLR